MKMKIKSWIYSLMLMGMVLIFSTAITYGQDSTETVTDIDGNVYKTVKIGTQIWMAEDLKVTKYNNGMPINCITDIIAWQGDFQGAYCWYNNDIANKNIFGALYNWYVIDKGTLAPKGWHVPTIEEWEMLIEFLGGEKIAGGKLKDSGSSFWEKPNTGADNSTGFTALPGGFRYGNQSTSLSTDFMSIGKVSYWWTSTKSNLLQAKNACVLSNNTKANITSVVKQFGFSVRCIKD